MKLTILYQLYSMVEYKIRPSNIIRPVFDSVCIILLLSIELDLVII